MTVETHGRAVIDALLDIVEAAMDRWHCGPEEAIAKIQALRLVSS